MALFTADCWFLTGPTASGKSEIALRIAERSNAEIIALDSMTFYRGMDIGTSKPSAADRSRVPHHLIDVLEPSEQASVDWYLRLAEKTCAEIRSRGKQPLFVGGTPLYLKAALRGLFDGPGEDIGLRTELATVAEREGNEALHARLKEADPAAAKRIQVGDTRRIIRALEVHQLTGKPISDWQQEFDKPADPCPKVACLMRRREELYARIDQRVLEMLDAGWIDEVGRLLAVHPPMSRQAAQAVGYAEIAAHLRGELEYSEMVELIQRRTRQFSKRQRTWFRHLEELTIFDIDEVGALEDVTQRIQAFFTADAAKSI